MEMVPEEDDLKPAAVTQLVDAGMEVVGLTECVVQEEDDLKPAVVSQLVDVVKEVIGLTECNNICKKMYGDLLRRVQLLSPFFDELRNLDEKLGEEVIKGLESLKIALDSALELLKSVNRGSKLYQALEIEITSGKFRDVTEQIEKALCRIPLAELDLSDEVREQTELVHAQFKRAKGKIEMPDLQLFTDLALAEKEKDPNPAIMGRLSEMLHLGTIADLKKEAHAFHDLVILSGGELGESFGKMSSLLKKLNDYVQKKNSEVHDNESDKGFLKHRCPVIPDDFRCPISLELMRDPVIVSTGQTYERSCIQKWLDAGHRTCPKTHLALLHVALTPNYALKSLIALWCESNGIELPKKQGNGRNRKAGSSFSDCDQGTIEVLLTKLKDGTQEQKRAAAGELRLLAKRNTDYRVCIAEAGAIPLLVKLLSSEDPRTQEHAVTALLNLSINDSNKRTIVEFRAIPSIVEVLKNGSMEARENAAATLFSLSVLDENKIAIGASGAIPALITLLCDGSPRGKKDAATAIFNLSIHQGNKARAVRAGIVNPLMSFLEDVGGCMVDESLSIMAILSSHQEGKAAIGEAEPIPALLEVIKTGSPRNKENATSILWSLCANDLKQLERARQLGGEEAMKDLSENGTDRGKRKAGSILEQLRRLEVTSTS